MRQRNLDKRKNSCKRLIKKILVNSHDFASPDRTTFNNPLFNFLLQADEGKKYKLVLIPL